MMNFDSVEDAVEAAFRSALRDIDRQKVSRDEVVSEAVNRLLPKDHIFHVIAALAFRCTGCGHVGFIRDVGLDIDAGGVSCPNCDADDTLRLIEDGVA